VAACLPFLVVLFLMSAGVLLLAKFWKILISKIKKDYFVMIHDISVFIK
jgi:hypothetical protein